MNQDDVLRLAREAGMPFEVLPDDYCAAVGLEPGTVCIINDVKLEAVHAFAELVAADVMQRCEAAASARRNEIERLRGLLDGVLRSDVGRMTLQKLEDGQGTATDDGKAWLDAARLLKQITDISGEFKDTCEQGAW